MSWKESARQLSCGSRRRIAHCKDDNSMLISHDLKGVRCHCFRCGFHGFIPHGVQRVSDLMRRAKEFREKVSRTGLTFPEDYTLDVPPHAMTWYLQYGITQDLASMYSIGYSPSMERVVLPVYEDGELSALQLRALNEDTKPKYLNPSAYEISDVLFTSEDTQARVGVVVEDFLSCIKVGQLIPTASILGTKMSDARAAKLANLYQNIIMWFDNDQAGATAYKKAGRLLSLMGVNVYEVHTDKDPKKYTKKQIKEILRGAERWR